MFADREDAGRRLADLLDKRDGTADLMLTVLWGGLPVGRKVADHLGVPLDVAVASKASAPDSPEFTVGTVAGNGSTWWNENLLSYLDVGKDYLGRERECETAAARDKVSLYRGGDPLPDVVEKRIVVVDDGTATGATVRTCLRQVVTGGAERVALAAPAGPPNALSELEAEHDTVVAVEPPEVFGVVDALYRDFVQTSNEEVVMYLRGGAGEH